MQIKKHKKAFVFISLTTLWIIFIYCNSMKTAEPSLAQSDFVLEFMQKAISLLGFDPLLISSYLVRKLAHLSEYMILGFLLSASVRAVYAKIKPHIFLLLFLGLVIPVSDEFLQLFVSGRSGMVEDVVLDFTGVILGLGFYIVMVSFGEYRRRKKELKIKKL